MLWKALLLIFISSIASALTNSQREEHSLFQSVVFIKAMDVDPQGEESTAYCNATLLSPDLLITAAHCVKGNVAIAKFQVVIEVGNYKYAPNKDGGVRRVGYVPYLSQTSSYRAYFLPSLAQKIARQGVRTAVGPAEDLAVLELAQPLSLAVDFPFVKLISQANMQGLVDRVLQYRPTVVSINPFEEMSMDTKRSAQLNALSKTWSGYWESKSTARVQPGDSGAPLFVNIGGDWVLAGITKGRGETVFSNWDVYGILDKKICEIAKQIGDGSKQSLLCH